MKCVPAMLALAAYLSAQTTSFEAETRLVLTPVAVTDKKGRPVDGLEAADFTILDNGRPQKLSVDSFATGVAPIALVVAVQTSGISAPVLAKVRKIGSMIQPVITGEYGCAGLMAFDQRLRWLQECTNDVEALSRAFEQLRPGDTKGGRMLDAVSEAVHQLRQRRNVRRVVLLISESRDRGSESEIQPVVMAAQSAGVMIYAATYSAMKTAFTTRPSDSQRREETPRAKNPGTDPGSRPGRENVPDTPVEQRVDLIGGFEELFRLGAPHTARLLTSATGGVTLPFTRQKGLEEAIEKLGSELHTQYVLSFAPEAPAPGYHKLEVRVTRRGDFRVRARPGYWWTQ